MDGNFKSMCVCALVYAIPNTFLVYYGAEKNELVPMSRLDVWNAINGAIGRMDKYGIFCPESHGYRVTQIFYWEKGLIVVISHLVRSSVMHGLTAAQGRKKYLFSNQIQMVLLFPLHIWI